MKMLRLRSFITALLLLSCIPAAVHGCDLAQWDCGASAPGDIILGIMLPFHLKVREIKTRIRPEEFECYDFDPEFFMMSLATIHEIEKINAAGILPGIRLGYLICDTCSYASKALHNVEQMLAVNMSLKVQCDYINFTPNVKIIFGAGYSEVSIAVARLLNVYMVPLLSSTSSSPELSNKPRYASFIRTIPSDTHQTKALAKIMHHFNWTWVGVVYQDDDYGRAAFQSFVQDAEPNDVCLAYQEKLPHYLDPAEKMKWIRKLGDKIRSSNAKVVLLILHANMVEYLFQEMIRTNTSRTWIASDSWSSSSNLAQMDGINQVGDILGFKFASSNSESFKEYLKNLRAPPGGYNHFVEEYKNLRFNCTPECFSDKPPSYCPTKQNLKMKSDDACSITDPQQQNDDYLVKNLDTSKSFSNRVAVWAVANALKKLLKCNRTSCSGEIDFPPWKLLKELKRVNFQFENQKFYFDEHGDFVNGYDLITWEKGSPHRRFMTIGRYSVLDEMIKVTEDNITWLSTEDRMIPQSRCSEPCKPGYFKKILNVSCCYNCTQCPEGTFSDDWDLHVCKNCSGDLWSLKGWNHCERRKESFLHYEDAHPISMMAAAGFGILLLFFMFVFFLVNRNTGPMKRAEVRLSSVMMAGLAVSFASVICFMGRPNKHLCQARQVMYAMGFTLCVSCILVKAYRTFLAFLPFSQIINGRLHKLYKPPVIIVVITALQGIICLLWLLFDSPEIDDTPTSPQSMKQIIQCNEGPKYIGFGLMFSYIAFLAMVGFLLAFKGRRVPQEFSETGYIIFSMLMYLFVWVCFIPVYITNTEEGTLVQASAILVSSYGIIFCHFLPKCYEVLCGSKVDPLEKILTRWRRSTSQRSSVQRRSIQRSSSQRSSSHSLTFGAEAANDISVVINDRSNRLSVSSTTTILSPIDSDLYGEPIPIKNISFSPFPQTLGSALIKRRRCLSC